MRHVDTILIKKFPSLLPDTLLWHAVIHYSLGGGVKTMSIYISQTGNLLDNSY